MPFGLSVTHAQTRAVSPANGMAFGLSDNGCIFLLKQNEDNGDCISLNITRPLIVNSEHAAQVELEVKDQKQF